MQIVNLGELIDTVEGFDFLPCKEERVILKDREYVVDNIVYTDSTIYIFVVRVSPYFIKLIPKIFKRRQL